MTKFADYVSRAKALTTCSPTNDTGFRDLFHERSNAQHGRCHEGVAARSMLNASPATRRPAHVVR